MSTSNINEIPYLFDLAPNLELAPTSNKRPPKKWKKLISAQPRISAHPLPPKNAHKKKKERNSALIVKWTRGVDYFISSVAYNG